LRQKSIIKWTTAHLISMMTAATGGGNIKTQRSIGDGSESYARPTAGTNFQATSYGQMAVSLDPNGCLVNLGRVKAAFVCFARGRC
jgi:hypothetical protein